MKISRTPTTPADIEGPPVFRPVGRAEVQAAYLAELVAHEKVTTYGPAGSDILKVVDRLVVGGVPGALPHVERTVVMRPPLQKIALSISIDGVRTLSPAEVFRRKAHRRLTGRA